MTFGTDIESKENPTIENFDRYLYPEYYDSYNTEEISSFIEYQNYDVSTNQGGSEAKESNPIEMTTQLLDGPMDSPWPMYCHDTRHTGCSPYSTADNPHIEKWRFMVPGITNHCAPVIDNDGVIYIAKRDLYAINPNGTQKWRFDYLGRVLLNGGVNASNLWMKLNKAYF